MKTETFKLVGLSKPKSATLESPDGLGFFSCPLEMAQDRFNALFNYFKKSQNSWTGNEKAVVRCESTDEDGYAINGTVIEVQL